MKKYTFTSVGLYNSGMDFEKRNRFCRIVKQFVMRTDEKKWDVVLPIRL